MTKEKNILVDKENQGARLDKFLTEKMPETTRSQIKLMIKAGKILVNGQEASVHCFLKEGDEIEIKNRKLEIGGAVEKQTKKQSDSSFSDSNIFKEIKIIADEPDFLIIEKPAGLLVHPTTKNETNTLVDWIIQKYPKLIKIGESPERPALVHRLDKEVSGLMIIPKTQDAFDFFKSQFKEHKITKKYLTLVYGEVKADEGKIDFAIGRSNNKKGTFAARSKNQELAGKKALTYFKVVKRSKNFTLLEVEILTGRTHQIRVHLLAYGYPVVGDPLYQPKRTKTINLNRIFLHAYYLKFRDQSNEEREYKSELPEELKEIGNRK